MEITFESSVTVRALEFLPSPDQPAQPALQVRNFVQIGKELLLLTVGLRILLLIDGNDVVIGSNVLAVGAELFGKFPKVNGSALKHRSQPMVKVTPSMKMATRSGEGILKRYKRNKGLGILTPWS